MVIRILTGLRYFLALLFLWQAIVLLPSGINAEINLVLTQIALLWLFLEILIQRLVQAKQLTELLQSLFIYNRQTLLEMLKPYLTQPTSQKQSSTRHLNKGHKSTSGTRTGSTEESKTLPKALSGTLKKDLAKKSSK